MTAEDAAPFVEQAILSIGACPAISASGTYRTSVPKPRMSAYGCKAVML